jgi:hypothetical protein
VNSSYDGDSAFRLASHENLRMMSLSCSTIVALFHLLSSVLTAMTASSAIVARFEPMIGDPLHVVSDLLHFGDQ